MAKEKKAPKKKVLSDLSKEKQRETLFTLYFLKPSVRRIGYWYKGLNIGHGANFVLGSEPENKFSHGNPSHAVSLVSVKNMEHVAVLDSLFTDIGLMNDFIEIVDMKNLSTQLSKAKWDTTKLKFYRNNENAFCCFNEALEGGNQHSVLSTPLVSLFVLRSIGLCMQEQFRVLESDRKDVIVKQFSADDIAYEHVVIPKETIDAVTHISEVFPTEIRFVGIRGLDLLQTKPFKGEEDLNAQYLLWRPTEGSVLDYFHVIETPDVRITATRLYVYLFPKRIRKVNSS